MSHDMCALTCGEICHVGKHVEYIDGEERQEGVLPEGLDGILEAVNISYSATRVIGGWAPYLDFISDIEGIVIPAI